MSDVKTGSAVLDKISNAIILISNLRVPGHRVLFSSYRTRSGLSKGVSVMKAPARYLPTMLTVCVVFFLSVIVSPTVLAKRPLTPEDIEGVTWLGSPRISPDGTRIAFVVTEPADTTDPAARPMSDIWIVSASGKDAARRYAFSSHNESDPRWSPDGTYLAFLSDRETPDKNQVFLLRTDGGEAEKLTSAKTGVRNFRWGPEGRFIAYTMTDTLTSEEESENEAKDDEIVIDQELKYQRLYVMDLETREPVRISPDNIHVSEFDWSPDGSQFAVQISNTPHVDDVYWHSRLVVMERSSGEIETLVEGTLGNIAWSPDGKTIAFFHPAANLTTNIPAVISPSGGQPRLLIQNFPGSVWMMKWMPDSQRLMLFALDGVYGTISTLDTKKNSIELVKKLSVVYYSADKYSFSGDGKKIAFLNGSVDHPEELWVMQTRGRGDQKLTSFNQQLAEIEFAAAEVMHWTSTDGRKIQGVLFTPPGYETGKRYPTIVSIHGGPEWAWWYGWHGSWHEWAQLLASNGYVVLLPNIRGSAGYGVDFSAANLRDWGGKDLEDLLTGVDYLIKEGITDESRMGICGWSYGGFMTSWTVTQTDRFKAAMAGAAVTNLVSFHGTTDISPSFMREYFDTIPYVNPELFRNRSAVNFANQAKTPTLILHGEADVRVPVGQAYELYRGLKQSGVETELVLYPREGHGFRERAHRIDLMTRILEWFDKHL
jgi:dipeptidyl aminopeptidase/acylaminoacyl peptidase